MFNNIRLAEGRDIPYLLQLCHNAHKASPYKNTEFDPLVVLELLRNLVEGDKTKGVVIIATDDIDHPIGLIMAVVGKAHMNNNPVAQEVIWWVEPEFRKSKSGIALYRSFKFWAEKVGCQIVIISSYTDERFEKILKRDKFNVKEYTFIGGI